MSSSVLVTMIDDRFVARVGDGRELERTHLGDLARALCALGIRAERIRYEWTLGQRMLTAGQRVALLADIRLLEQEQAERRFAA